ncbi:hypothetical protein ACWDU1_31520, partial [Nocardia sp. NPDC003345]
MRKADISGTGERSPESFDAESFDTESFESDSRESDARESGSHESDFFEGAGDPPTAAETRAVRRSGPTVRRGGWSADPTTGELQLDERSALRRIAGLSTELTDITEVEYRQLRL